MRWHLCVREIMWDVNVKEQWYSNECSQEAVASQCDHIAVLRDKTDVRGSDDDVKVASESKVLPWRERKTRNLKNENEDNQETPNLFSKKMPFIMLLFFATAQKKDAEK